MTKVLTNKENLKDAIAAAKRDIHYAQTNSERIGSLFSNILNNTHRVDVTSTSVKNDNPSRGDAYDYTAYANAYNLYMSYIADNVSETAANSIKNDLNSGIETLEILSSMIDVFEESPEIKTAIQELKDSVEDLDDSVYGEIYYYSSEGSTEGTSEAEESEKGNVGGGNGGSDWEDHTTTVDEEHFGDLDEGDEDTGDTSEDDESDKDPLDDGDTDTGDTHEDDESDKDPLDDGDGEDPGDTHEDDGSDKDPLDDGDADAGETDEDDQQTGDEATMEDLIGTSIDSLIDDGHDHGSGSGVTGTGADGVDDWESAAAAGAGALMLGMGGLGLGDGDENYLENLASGVDDERTLADMGLDVFEHPDYINGENPDMLSNESASEIGTEDMGDIDPDSLDGFNVKAAAELEGADEGANHSSALGVGALAGAAAVGGLAAGGLIGADEANGGLFDGGAGIGPDGRYQETKKSINDILFGSLNEEDDEEEKKRQQMRERIAMIATASSLAASTTTFGLSNADLISPFWFMLSVLLLAASMLYFNLVIDKKNKRREELQAKNKVMGRKSFFGNNKAPIPEEAPGQKEVDWVLFGMIMLSTSSFILKTYDVINWLLFIILLILFVLIIFAYILLKKKLGENDKNEPYLK